MKLLGQMIWELGEFFGDVIWQMMATVQIIAALVIVGVIIEHLIGTRPGIGGQLIGNPRTARTPTTDQTYGWQ